MRIAGVDPGFSGGFVLLVDGCVWMKAVMPVTQLKKADGGNKSEYLEADIASLFREMKPDMVFIEKQHPMKGQGLSSTFSTGLGFGLLRGMASGLSLPFTLVPARTWQKCFFDGQPKKDTGKLAALVCSRLWPACDFRVTERSRVPHSGLCDAALIARYGWLMMKGEIRD